MRCSCFCFSVGAGLPAMAASQPTNFKQATPNPDVGAAEGCDLLILVFIWALGVHIRCCGNGCLGFRPYGGSLFPDAEKVTKKACSNVRPAR